MRALIDTHAFLWAIAGDRRTSDRARDIFVGPSDLLFSIVSVWEILVKAQLGKLDIPRPAGPYVLRKLAENRIEILAISIDQLLAFERLPLHHRDPFDRMLIAQALEENLPIVTADHHFSRYPVEVIW
jgi:PIN domain nuclease of toxin-antitoxin system